VSDDDVTPPRGRAHPGSPWNASQPRGVPVVAPPAPSAPHRAATDAFELIERDLSQAGIEVVNRSKRNSSDPAVFADIVNLADELLRERRERDSSNEERKAQLDEILEKPRTIAVRLAAVEATLKTARRLLIAAILTLGGGVGTIASGLLSNHDASVGDAVRAQQLRKDVDRLDGDLRDIRIQLGRRSELSPAPLLEKGPLP